MPKKKDAKTKNKEEDKKTPLDSSVDVIVTQLKQLNGAVVEEKKFLNEYFQQETRKLYPDLGKVTYKVPAAHFNRGKVYEDMKGKGKKLDYYVKKSMSDGDARGDRAHAFVLNLLEAMSDNLMMKGTTPLFILNSYHSDSYLQRLCKVSSSRLPGDLGVWDKRGEMDCMVLKPGLVVFIETKSTGDNRGTWAAGEDTYSAFGKKLTEVFKQLDKYETMFNINMEESLREPIQSIHRVAALPNLSLEDIDDIVKAGHLTKEDVSNSKYKLLCSDSLQSIDVFTQWWLANIEEIEESSAEEGGSASNNNNSAECDEMEEMKGVHEMRIMIGRYLSDMSVVEIARSSQISSPFREVRRQGQAVNATGHEFARIVLTRLQVDFVNNDQVRLGYLNGPPGSGKTVVMAIRARRWILDQGGVTFILNMYRGSKGRSIGKKTQELIYDVSDTTKKDTLKGNCHEISIDVDQFTTESREKCMKLILDQCPKKERLLFLVDETYVQSYWQAVFDMLIKDFTEAHMWLAGLYGGKPDHFESMALTKVMRCPPNVQKVLRQIDWIDERCQNYTLDSTKADMVTDGAYVMVLHHKFHSYPSEHPAQCWECGEDLVNYLEKTLNVSKTGSKTGDRPADLQVNSLTCQDVVLLVNLPRDLYRANENGHLDTTEQCYIDYMKLLESSPLIKTLNNNKYQTKVHTSLPEWELAKREEDVIHVSWVFSYQGLENKVIIFLPAGPAMMKQDVLNRMKEDEQAVWKDARCNIPCPGLAGRHLDQLENSGAECKPDVKFSQTDLNSAFDGDVLDSGDEDKNGLSSLQLTEEEEEEREEDKGRQYRESGRRRSTLPIVHRLRRWEVKDLGRYNRWDKNTLFISASRSTAQLLMVIP